MKKQYDEVFKIDSKGKTRVWYCTQTGDSYSVTSGIYKGNLVTSAPRKAEPTNVGRSNERNGVEQAKFEIESLYKKQLETGYHEDLAHVATGVRTKTFFEPMLCEKYKSGFPWPVVWSQPKLDGMRCVARKSGLWSRGGKRIVSCPHIERTLAPLFEKAPNMILDGELYNHDFKADFDELISILKQQKPTADDFAKSEEFAEYHMYDAPSFIGGFDERFKAFSKMDEKKYPGLKLVETTVIHSKDQLDKAFEMYNEQGYEGQIIRLGAAEYEEGKRSKNLLKRKLLYEGKGGEAEYELAEIREGKGNWKGKAKAILFWKPGKGRDPVLDRFKATLKGDMANAEKVYKNRDKYVGKNATVTYQNLTPKGTPRFGIIKELVRWDI
jgi:DNA ligase-1